MKKETQVKKKSLFLKVKRRKKKKTKKKLFGSQYKRLRSKQSKSEHQDHETALADLADKAFDRAEQERVLRHKELEKIRLSRQEINREFDQAGL